MLHNNNGLQFNAVASKGVQSKVWIDGFAVTCSRSQAKAIQYRIKTVAKEIGAVFKGDGVVVEDEYDFVGIHFNHNNKTVRVADKTVKKLPSPSFSTHQNIKISELEKLISRLIFCSSVVRIILGEYFFYNLCP